MPRIPEFFRTENLDPKLAFARGAVLVFGAQACYIAVLLILTLIDKWVAVHLPKVALDHGPGRVVWFALVLGLTVAAMIAQGVGMRLLAKAVKPWNFHSIPAIASIAFSMFAFLVLLGFFVLLFVEIYRPGAKLYGG